MANYVQDALILAIMKADVDLDTVDARMAAMSSSYTHSAAHDRVNDITNVISDWVAVSGEAVAAVTAGANFDYADPTLTNVNGAAAKLALADFTGATDADRRYMAYWDTGITNFPTGTLSGGSIPLTMNSGGAFQIVNP